MQAKLVTIKIKIWYAKYNQNVICRQSLSRIWMSWKTRWRESGKCEVSLMMMIKIVMMMMMIKIMMAMMSWKWKRIDIRAFVFFAFIKSHFKGETEKLKKKAEIDLRMTQVLSAVEFKEKLKNWRRKKETLKEKLGCSVREWWLSEHRRPCLSWRRTRRSRWEI